MSSVKILLQRSLFMYTEPELFATYLYFDDKRMLDMLFIPHNEYSLQPKMIINSL